MTWELCSVPSCENPDCMMEDNINYADPATTIKQEIRPGGIYDCASWCAKTSECTHWVIRTNGGKVNECFLKSSNAGRARYTTSGATITSGTKACGRAAGCVPEVEKCSGSKCKGYRGKQTKTRSGRTCQAWDQQTPHTHAYKPASYPEVEANYCRNPSEGATIWCYTLSPGKKWEYCDPLQC